MDKYLELVKTIESVVKNDYSGSLDKKAVMHKNSISLKKLGKNITRNDFYDLVSDYLRLFKDRHLQLLNNSSEIFSNGFKVRRFEDGLVVTHVFQNIELEVGDLITHLNNTNINEIELDYRNYFFSDDKSRQDWGEIIRKFQMITYIRSEVEYNYDLEKFDPMYIEPTYEFKYNNNVPTLILSDFNDENAIAHLIKDNEDKIKKADDLIIDVRNNAGGSDLSYLPLLKFIFDKPIKLSELSEETMSVLYSKRNCEIRIEMLNEILESSERPPEHIIEYIEKEINLYKENYGKGFMTIKDDGSFDFEIKGDLKPKRVYILTDQYCGSSGDSFVKLAKLSPKVTVVGRNTMGVLDYSNVAYLDLDDDFILMYPTSRMNNIDDGLGIDNIGISPDVKVKWTPEHLIKDLDVEKVLELIKDNN